jgi:hypothetical protein
MSLKYNIWAMLTFGIGTQFFYGAYLVYLYALLNRVNSHLPISQQYDFPQRNFWKLIRDYRTLERGGRFHIGVLVSLCLLLTCAIGLALAIGLLS